MPTYSFEYEDNLRRAIRDIKALDPLITNVALTERLSKQFDHSFDRAYITKLSGKVARQTLIQMDREQIEERLQFTRENYRMVREQLAKILYWTPEDAEKLPRPAAKDRVEAGKTMVMLDLAVLNAEIANGLYKKPVAALVKEFQYEPLHGEIRAVIIAAWQRGGLLPKEAIEEMVPITGLSPADSVDGRQLL